MAVALRILAGPGSGSQLPIGTGLTVGHDAPPPGNMLGDQTLSALHAVFRPVGETGVLVEDISAGNVTQVNGRGINAPTQLGVGDRVLVGVTPLKVELVAGPAVPAATPDGSASETQVVPRLDFGAPRAQAQPVSHAQSVSHAQPVAQSQRVPLPAWQQAGTSQPATSGRGRGRAVFAVIVALALIAGSFVGGLALGKHNKSTTRAQLGALPGGGSGDQSPSGTCMPADSGRAGAGHFRFNTGACENGTTDVTAFILPLHKGTHKGQTVWYVIMDVSDQATALRLGVNFVPKLANAKGTAGVQKVTQGADGTVDFPGTVDFKHTRVLTLGPDGFPPATGAQPPSVGDARYSPLIQLPNGIVENAPQVANDSGKAHKVLNLNTFAMKVLFRAQNGFYENKAVHYASFDSSDRTVAAIEDVTYAPTLTTIPGPNNEDVKTSAREQLIAFINGPSGPFGQGVNYALQTGGANPSPKNLLHETPQLPQHDDVGSLDYTPMWDVHLAQWTQAAVDSGARVQMRDVNTVLDQKVKPQAPDPALVTGPGGKPYGAANVIVNCPLVSIDIP